MKTNKELFDLSGQVAIVTGGAYGLGVQMAYALGEAGANLVIAARKVDKCKEAAAKMEKELGIKVLPARLDLTVPEEIDALFELVNKEYGKVDILVNNSGVVLTDPIFKYPLDKWHQVIDTNLTGLWLMCQKAGSMMSRQGYGRIVNISSITGLVGFASDFVLSPPYSASKAAVIGLTRDLAVKWAKKNVTVNALIPGWFGSDMGDMNSAVHTKLNDYYIPVGHFGTDDELKAAVLFLASPGASYVTGITLPVDGGLVAQ
ncbi:MAG: SDR family oxidoreductase [Syntrophomonadaceae bacterium]|jgi:gluconate 5-dehydrogenase|nr:SDR family oxidoreductase [Syntrophomonadaceae bacterium]